MAKKSKKSRGKPKQSRERSVAQPSANGAETTPNQAPERPDRVDEASQAGPLHVHPARSRTHWIGRTTDVVEAGIAVVAWVLCSALGVFELETAQPALQTVASFALLGTALLLALANFARRADRADWGLGLRTFALGLATIALAAAVGRDATLHASPFSAGHGSFGGFPSELPFIGIAASALIAIRRPAASAARVVLVASCCWATAVLLWPAYDIDRSFIPLIAALEGLTDSKASALPGITHLFLALEVVGAWWLCFALNRVAGTGRGDSLVNTGSARLGTILQWSHIIVAAAHLGGAALGAGDASVVIAALVFLCGQIATRLLAETVEATSTQAHWLKGTRRLADWVLPGAILTLYALLKSHGMGPSNTDENIYFYMAADLGNGRVPYVDYFFAHPPLHVLVPGSVMSVTGFDFTLVKLFSPVAGGVTGLAVWLIGRRHFGRLAAGVALVSFLFAAETLKATTNMTGINLTTMWLMLGLWQSLAGHAVRAGLLFAMAALTGLYSAAAICAILLLSVFRPQDVEKGGRPTPLHGRFWVRQLASFLLLFGAIDLLFRSLAGNTYVDGVYTYHGLKAKQDPTMQDLDGIGALIHNIGVMVDGRPFTKELYYHANLWVGFFSAPLLAAWVYLSSAADRLKPLRFLDPRRFFQDGAAGLAAVIWLVAFALFVQYAMFKELYSFYFVLIYPVLALLIGYTVQHAIALGAGVLPKLRPSATGLVGAVVVLSVFATWQSWSASALPIFGEDARYKGSWRGAAKGQLRIVKENERLKVTLDERFTLSAKAGKEPLRVSLRRLTVPGQTPPPVQILGKVTAPGGAHVFQWPVGRDPQVGDAINISVEKTGKLVAQARLKVGPYGAANDYVWTAAPSWTFASDVVRTLFWSDQRIRGSMEPGYRYYLWTKKRNFESLDRVAAFVAEHTSEDETIAGGSTIAPLVALTAGRRLAAGEVDTNTKRFRSGLLMPDDYWTRICADNVKLLVAVGRGYFNPRRISQLKTVRRWFRVAKVFKDQQLSYGKPFPITIFERIGDGPCRWEDPPSIAPKVR